jgi:hypothetical protein
MSNKELQTELLNEIILLHFMFPRRLTIGNNLILG